LSLARATPVRSRLCPHVATEATLVHIHTASFTALEICRRADALHETVHRQRTTRCRVLALHLRRRAPKQQRHQKKTPLVYAHRAKQLLLLSNVCATGIIADNFFYSKHVRMVSMRRTRRVCRPFAFWCERLVRSCTIRRGGVRHQKRRHHAVTTAFKNVLLSREHCNRHPRHRDEEAHAACNLREHYDD
jgi:hypothetical protein